MTSSLAAGGLLLMMAAQEKACPWLWVGKIDATAPSANDSSHPTPEPPTIGQTLETAVLGRTAAVVGGVREESDLERNPNVDEDGAKGRLANWRLEPAPGTMAHCITPCVVSEESRLENRGRSPIEIELRRLPRDPALGSTIMSLAPPRA